MLLLAVESATDAAAVALADDDGVLVSVTAERGRRHAETLAPAIDFACRQAGVAPADVEAVAVDIGPGLFTGLRVGVGTAKAFAGALGLPVVAVGSLQLLAQAAADTGLLGAPGQPDRLVAVVDARRGEVFWAPFAAGAAGADEAGAGSAAAGAVEAHRRGPDAVCPPDVLAADVPAGSLLVGDGAARYRTLLGAAGHQVAGPLLAHPPVGVLARVGLRRLAAGAAVAATAVAPRYLRQADARINWERRLPPRPAPAP